MINNSKGFLKGITSGVVPGSCLGSLIFVANVNDIDCPQKYCKISKYADDIKLYQVISKHKSLIKTSMLQGNLNALHQCAIDW